MSTPTGDFEAANARAERRHEWEEIREELDFLRDRLRDESDPKEAERLANKIDQLRQQL